MDVFEWDDNEGANYVGSLKHDNNNYSNERKINCRNVMEKY